MHPGLDIIKHIKEQTTLNTKKDYIDLNAYIKQVQKEFDIPEELLYKFQQEDNDVAKWMKTNPFPIGARFRSVDVIDIYRKHTNDDINSIQFGQRIGVLASLNRDKIHRYQSTGVKFLIVKHFEEDE